MNNGQEDQTDEQQIAFLKANPITDTGDLNKNILCICEQLCKLSFDVGMRFDDGLHRDVKRQHKCMSPEEQKDFEMKFVADGDWDALLTATFLEMINFCGIEPVTYYKSFLENEFEELLPPDQRPFDVSTSHENTFAWPLPLPAVYRKR